MDDENLTLNMPKELTFTSDSLTVPLLLENPTNNRLVFKIRTNHKTAISINPTHDFINAWNKREIPVKLIELHQGIKLEINYAKPTEEMTLKNDPKMTNIDKKQIRKSIVVINIKNVASSRSQKQIKSVEEDMNSSFMSISGSTKVNNTTNVIVTGTTNNTEEIKVEQKGSGFIKGQNAFSEGLSMVQQHPEEDDDELEERKKRIQHEIENLTKEIEEKEAKISKIREQQREEQSEKSVIPPKYLVAGIFTTYFIGSLAKYCLMG